MLSSSTNLVRFSTSFYGGNAFFAVSLARDKVDATSGLIALGVGFALQAAGYIASASTASDVEPSWRAGFLALAIVIAAAGFSLVLSTLRREARVRRLLLEMAMNDVETGARHPFALNTRADGYARVLGFSPREGENGLEFARRVWSVDDVLLEGTNPPRRASEVLEEQRQAQADGE